MIYDINIVMSLAGYHTAVLPPTSAGRRRQHYVLYIVYYMLYVI